MMVGMMLVPALLTAQQPAMPPADNSTVMSFKFFAAHYGGWLVAAFDSIPERDYGYRPTRAQRSVGNIVQHLDNVNYGLCERLGTPRPAWTVTKELPDTANATWPKDTLVARLRTSLAFCDAVLSRLNDAQLEHEVAYGPAGAGLTAMPSRVLVGFVTDLAEHYSQIASYMRQLGLVPPSALPPKQRVEIDLPTDRLSPYVGTYDLSPSAFQGAPALLLVTRISDGALYLKPTGRPEVRLWPESATDFFVKEVDAQVTFTRDASRRVIGLVLHQNGEDRVARKVK
jgi:uncharacterized damage-inducible protein DinB